MKRTVLNELLLFFIQIYFYALLIMKINQPKMIASIVNAIFAKKKLDKTVKKLFVQLLLGILLDLEFSLGLGWQV